MPPRVIVLFAGKRKSGKDFCAERLYGKIVEKLGGSHVALRGVSHPLKEEYAQLHGLDLEQLKSASDYKEAHRAAMVAWGEKVRERDASYFCRKVFDTADSPVLIVTDCRRPSDLEFFRSRDVVTISVRVESAEETRAQRGYRFTVGVDDSATECALDDREDWDFVILNEPTANPSLDVQLDQLADAVLRRQCDSKA